MVLSLVGAHAICIFMESTNHNAIDLNPDNKVCGIYNLWENLFKIFQYKHTSNKPPLSQVGLILSGRGCILQ
jgi:hypothetical protein